jgi:rhamnulokinase
LNLTNEGGVGGTFRVLKNIMGLWLLQQCRKAWAAERAYGYEDIVEMAAAAPAFGPLVDPDREEFLNPPDMPEAIRRRCRETGERPPETKGELARCVLESLALKYRLVLDQLREVHPHGINRIHVIGGGTRNEMLCQLTADATGLPVSAGPAEATAVGNLLVQALGTGCLDSVAEVREVVRRSFPPKRHQPRKEGRWGSAYERFRGLCGEDDRTEGEPNA